jgi:hypothetical protein
LFTQVGGTVDTRDLFGWSLAAGDVNNNGFADLAAGAPWETVGSLGKAGAVSVIPGSAGGLTSTGGRLFTQAQAGGTVEAGDQFGAQLAAGDFNNNGFADLAAAAASESVGSAVEAGAVSVLRPSGAGVITGYLYTQDTPGVPDTAEGSDHFGGIGFQAE